MGSSDYLNSARRAAIVFLLLATGALAAAGSRLAVSAWSGAPTAFGASAKPQREPLRPAGDACWERSAPRCANLRVANGPTDALVGL